MKRFLTLLLVLLVMVGVAEERVAIDDLHAILSKACNMRETFKKLK